MERKTAEVIYSSPSLAEVHVRGDLDVMTAVDLDQVLDEIQEKGVQKILIDCSQLDYVSSPGIGVFTSRLSNWKSSDTSVVLFQVQPNVANVFKILGLSQLMQMTENREMAEQLLNAN